MAWPCRSIRWLGVGGTVALVCAGCQSVSPVDLSDLAAEDPLPYSVLLTGGTFVRPGPSGELAEPMQRTYRPTVDGDEAVPFEILTAALQSARVFVRIEADDVDVMARRDASSGERLPGVLERAQRRQHDFVLVVKGIDDDRIEARGINGQWPITAATWLLVGLGMLIPDHTFESQASLSFELRDARTDRVVHVRQLPAVAINLPLVQRSGLLGLLTSILIPPFWVGDEQRTAEETVRAVTTNQLIASLARELKNKEVRKKLQAEMPAQLAIEVFDVGLLVSVTTADALSEVRLRTDLGVVEGKEFDSFRNRLLYEDVERQGSTRSYSAKLEWRPAGQRLQLLVQTVTGRVASMTVELRR